MSPRGIATVVALLAVTTLTACGEGDNDSVNAAAVTSAAPSAATTDASATPAPVPTEGSVTDPANRFVTYPDRFTARIAKVEQVPAEWGVDIPAGTAVVRVTIDLNNAGTAPVPLVDPTPHMALYYGPNRAEAHPEAGYSSNARQTLQNELPQRVAPGHTVHYVRSFTVPSVSLGDLAVYVSPQPEHYTEYTFTDAQTVLRRVH